MVQQAPIRQPVNGLHKGYLSFIEVLGYALGLMGISGAVVIVVPLIFASAGNASWLVLLLSALAYLLVAAQINVFTKRMASPGSLYAYVHKGWGSLPAAITGWSLVLGYLMFLVVNIASVPYFLILVVQSVTGVNAGPHMNGLVVAVGLIVLGIGWGMAHRDVRLSARTALIIEFATIALLLVIIGAYFWQHGLWLDRPQLELQGFNSHQSGMALVLAIAAFTGIEACAALGSEARSPFKSIPRAIIITILLAAFVIIGCTYGLVQAFHGLTPELDKDEAPFTTLAQSLGMGALGPIVILGVAIGWFGCLLGCLNTGGRLLYSFAQHGLFHRRFSHAHATYRTPHLPIALNAIVGFVITAALLLCGISPMDIVGYFATLGAFGFLIAYIMVSIAAPLYLRQTGQLKAGSVLSAFLAGALLTAALIGSLYPVPDWPSNLLPYIFLALLAPGVGYFFYLRKTDPARLRDLLIERADS